MQMIFKTPDKKEFSLGSVTFNWLDTHNIFDNYQEDRDGSSEIIFATSKENVKHLADDILSCANAESIRLDIKEKLIEFSKFVKESSGLIATIQ
jgi:hypothetical protein